jgi:hypothetical protein
MIWVILELDKALVRGIIRATVADYVTEIRERFLCHEMGQSTITFTNSCMANAILGL